MKMTLLPRSLLALLLVAVLTSPPAHADEMNWRHGLSLFGTLKYEPDFARFDYVNPDAPKGGAAKLSGFGGFDSLNPFVVKGQAAFGVLRIYDSLMATSFDEASSQYGLIAESVSHPEDFSSATFRLNANARWHDGTPITPADVVFTMETLKQAHPRYATYYANVASVEETGEREVTFTFDETGNRELPLIVSQLQILPKHYWEGTDENGDPRDFLSTSLEPPLGSGPYRVGRVNAPRTVVLERVEDYWAADHPVNIGSHNFDQIVYTYFRDTTVMFEAFKAGEFDFHVEGTPRLWETSYTFPAVENGWVQRDSYQSIYPERMQAFVFNTRRDKLSDARVRRAFNLAFNFEWTNENISYGLNQRINSYFAESELAASGLPEGRELEILEEVRDQVPGEVFTTEYWNPVHEDRRATRKHLRAALKLLKEAGWEVREGALTHTGSGERMSVEFLLVSPAFEPHVLAYKDNLEKLGIEVKVRVVDSSQYVRRRDAFDFDIIVGGWGQSLSPGNEQRNYWGSAYAEVPGSRNYAGIRNGAIDTLTERLIYAANRDDLVAATRALDRVLLWNHYVVPQWFRATLYAYWNRFGRPDPLPTLSLGFPDVWWYDRERAERIQTDQ